VAVDGCCNAQPISFRLRGSCTLSFGLLRSSRLDQLQHKVRWRWTRHREPPERTGHDGCRRTPARGLRGGCRVAESVGDGWALPNSPWPDAAARPRGSALRFDGSSPQALLRVLVKHWCYSFLVQECAGAATPTNHESTAMYLVIASRSWWVVVKGWQSTDGGHRAFNRCTRQFAPTSQGRFATRHAGHRSSTDEPSLLRPRLARMHPALRTVRCPRSLGVTTCSSSRIGGSRRRSQAVAIPPARR